MKKFYTTLLAAMLFNIIHAQGPFPYFEQTLGNGKSNRVANLITTNDSGYAVAGTTFYYYKPDADIFVMKVGKNAHIQWLKTYGTFSAEEAVRIIGVEVGGYLVVGKTSDSTTGRGGIMALRLDENGAVLWSRVVHNSALEPSVADVTETNDGDFVLTGSIRSGVSNITNFFLARLNAAGDVLWSRKVAIDDLSTGNAICKTGTNDFAISGTAQTFGNGFDLCFLKVNYQGAVLWARTFAGVEGQYDLGGTVLSARDNSILFGGESYTGGNDDWDNVLVKVRQDGSLAWSKRLGTTGVFSFDHHTSLLQNDAGDFIVTGSFDSSFEASSGTFMARVSNTGNFLQGSKLNTGLPYFIPESLSATSYGHYLLAATTELEPGDFFGQNPDVYVAKVTSLLGGCHTYPFSYTMSNFGTFATALPTQSSAHCSSYPVPVTTEERHIPLEYRCFPGAGKVPDLLSTNNGPGNTTGSSLRIYPNPAVGNTLFINANGFPVGEAMISVTSSTGNTMLKHKMNAVGSINYSLDISGLPKGSYFLSLSCGALEQKRIFLRQ